jgi:hypothetical protein
LHFEVILGNKDGANTVNPLKYVKW